MKKTIGRSETITLLDFSNISISSKIDTGAFSNALHVDGVDVINDVLKIWIESPDNYFLFDNYKRVEVKNSFGQKQTRWSVLTKIKLGKKIYKCRICLTKRNKMRFPMLIGRRFLYKFGYTVDVSKKNVYDKNKKM